MSHLNLTMRKRTWSPCIEVHDKRRTVTAMPRLAHAHEMAREMILRGQVEAGEG